jgi:hypothetical protein
MNKPKLLCLCDSPTIHTGFGRVAQALIDRWKPHFERIDIHAGSNVLNPIRFAVAKTHLQAKFSMAGLLTMIILRHRAGRQEFTDAFIGSQAAQDMQARIHTHVDPQIESQGMEIIRSRIELVTKDGRAVLT